jgi:uncharacterized delta-60 repeat protein
VYEVAAHGDGYVVAGSTRIAGDNDFMVARIRSDGTLDRGFGDDGSFTLDGMGAYDWAESVAVAPDGSIVAGGALSLDGNPALTVVRLTPRGDLDPSFGDGGVIVLQPDTGFVSAAKAVAIRPDGRVVATGWLNTSTATQVDLLVAQFTRDGDFDPTFGDDGIVVEDRTGGGGGARFEYAEDLALDGAGRIVVAGSTVVESNPGQFAYDALLARILPDGRLDPTFAGGGLTFTDVGGGRGDDIKAVAVAGDTAYVTGSSTASNGTRLLLARFDNGVLDRTYGAATGQLPYTVGAGGAEVVLDRAGRALAAAGSSSAIALVRFDSRGNPDTAFSPDGVFVRSLGARVDSLLGMALSPAGDELAVVGTSGPDYRPPAGPTSDVFVRTFGLAEGSGYWLLSDSGAVYSFGGAEYHGGATTGAGRHAVDMEPRRDGGGYWIVDDRGTVYGYNVIPLGGQPDLSSGERVTSMSATPSGRGYWLFTNLGRAIAFGDAPFLGDMAGIPLNGPVLDSVTTPSGQGYYMVASDGGIFTFGDAVFHGSMGGIPLNKPVESLVPSASANGYWLVASDGGVFSFGDAPFLGSMGDTPLNGPVTGMVRYGNGYLMVGADGGIFNFSDRPFDGSLGSSPPPSPIVAVAPVP